MFAKQFASWVSTLFVVGLAVAAIFAQVRKPFLSQCGPAHSTRQNLDHLATPKQPCY
jgi:hypothetical protein